MSTNSKSIKVQSTLYKPRNRMIGFEDDDLWEEEDWDDDEWDEDDDW